MTLSNFPNGITVDDIATIDENGLILDTTVYDDLRVPVLSTKLGGTKDPDFGKILDDGDSSQGVFAYLFDDSLEEELYFMCQIPHSWLIGGSLKPHIHWIPITNGTGSQKVGWGLEYVIADINSVFGNTTILYANTTTLEETLIAKKHYKTKFSSIDMSGINHHSAMIICRVFRDAAGVGITDDYPADVALLEIDFHYQINKLGTFTE